MYLQNWSDEHCSVLTTSGNENRKNLFAGECNLDLTQNFPTWCRRNSGTVGRETWKICTYILAWYLKWVCRVLIFLPTVLYVLSFYWLFFLFFFNFFLFLVYLGPAGTGKTESVKALGHQLGRFVLVFNCDETFDFQVSDLVNSSETDVHRLVSFSKVFHRLVFVVWWIVRGWFFIGSWDISMDGNVLVN